MIGNSKRSPRFIKAKTEEELQDKLLKMQILTGMEYAYLTIYRVKGGVVAWYYDIPKLTEKVEALNG